ncbi:MAG: DUF4149 domain-containing protein [Burkholderiaceae bacterium]
MSADPFPVSVKTRGEWILLAIYRIALTAWVGSAWTVGLLAAPVAFKVLEPRTLAGTFASHMFYWQAIVAFVCAGIVLGLHQYVERRLQLSRPIFWIIVATLALVAVQQFGLSPYMAGLRESMMAATSDTTRLELSDRFGTLHAVSSSLYLVQCVLGAWLIVRTR